MHEAPLSTQKPTLTVITDTLCGWCYGAAPLVDVLPRVADRFSVRFWHRAMFTGPGVLHLSPGFVAQVYEGRERFRRMTTQKLPDVFFERAMVAGGTMDSTWTANVMAAAASRGLDAQIAVSRALQTAHFQNAALPEDPESAAALLEPHGLDGRAIGNAGLTENAAAIRDQAAALMAAVDARGVPCIVLSMGTDGGAPEHFYLNHGPFLGKPDEFQDALTRIAEELGA